MRLDTAKVLWTLDLLPPEKLSQVATELLTEGFDCEALRLLAGLTSIEDADASKLFEQALRELGTPLLSIREAVICYTRQVSDEIIQGKIDPYEGAKKIWNASIKLDTPLHEVDSFIYAASEFEDRPEDREFFKSEIVKEARRWCSHRMGI